LRSFTTGRIGEINCVCAQAQFAVLAHNSWPDFYNVARPHAPLAMIKAIPAPEPVDSKTHPPAR
jgi:hypothetical protein